MLLSAKAISLLALASLVASRPSPHLARLDLVARDVVLSPDNSCGGTNNYTCPDNACCSASGWCGTTLDYCVDGCQADFGTCADPGDYAGTVSPDNSCGGTSGFICPTGSCCSANGWCGNTTDYCGTGCQSDFGSCSAAASGTASAGAPAASGGTSPDGTCGPSNNGYTCPTGECCSGAGYCGSTSGYCASPGCLSGYGDCDADTIPAGTNTSSVVRTLFGDVPFGSIIEDCHDAGNIALTFDDGPYTYTSDLLDLLANYSAKATFFITGNNNGKGEIDLYWADVIKKTYAAGHQIASHSWSHANFDELAPYQMRNELYKNEIALVSIIGKFPTYFRPPYSACGDACLAVMEELGYHAVLFDLDTQDYLHTTADTIQLSKDAVYDQMNGLDVSETDMLSIAHDIHWQTVYNLTGYMLEYMQGLGYNFVTVGECLQDPEKYWYRSAEDGTVSVSSEAPSSSSEAPSSASSASASVSSSFMSSESSSSFLSSASSSLDSSESPSSYSTLPPTSSSIPAAPSSTPSTLSTSTISSSPASSSAVSTPAPITSSSILSSSASSSSISITTSPTSTTTSSSGHNHTTTTKPWWLWWWKW